MIRVPPVVSLAKAEAFVAATVWPLERDGVAEIAFEPGAGPVEPWALAAVAAYALAAKRRDMDLRVSGVEGTEQPLRMGIAPFLDIDYPRDEHEPAGRYIALRQIKGNENLRLLFADIVPLLHLADEPEQAKAIQYCISEMVRNVQEHSGAEDGAVVGAELYLSNPHGAPRVSLGIADCGMGIRMSLSRNYDIGSELEAVLMAIQPRTSGARSGLYGMTDNAGAGLFFTRRLATTAAGQFAVISGSGFFRVRPEDAGCSDQDLAQEIPGFPGTIVAIEVSIETRFDLAEFLAEAGAAFNRMASTSKRASRRARFK